MMVRNRRAFMRILVGVFVLLAGLVLAPPRHPGKEVETKGSPDVVRVLLSSHKDRQSPANPRKLRPLDTTPPRIDRLTPAPGTWIVDDVGVTAVQIGFDEPVNDPTGAVTAWTVGGGAVAGLMSSYDGGTNTLTITFNPPVRDDRLTVVLDHSVTDVAGNKLDGEISSPENAALPSGDGQSGGPAVFRFNILQGDVNRDGVRDDVDIASIQVTLSHCVGDSAYYANADLNGDGCIDVLDVAIYTSTLVTSIPTLDAVAPGVAQITPDPAIGLTADLTSLVVVFSKALDPAHFHLGTCFLIDSAGGIFEPQSAGLDKQSITATYNFTAPVLPECDTYSIHLSNELADPSGRHFVGPASPPVLSGLSAPNPPTVADIGFTVTNQNPITFTVSAPGGEDLEVAGPDGVTTVPVPVTGDPFGVQVTLAENRLNQLFFTTRRECVDIGGAPIRSAPTVVTITHDALPPTLFIDFPADGAQVTTDTIDVAGRVADMLSGFEGLTVTVNTLDAAVDIGIGTNGTFFRADVPLSLGPNTITAVATDFFGNSTGPVDITVERVDIPANTPQMVVPNPGGNGQTAEILSQLAQPIEVDVTHANGSAFANKVVTFKVTRSDGRLAADPTGSGALMLQVQTDSFGRAQAYWTLGRDAGWGNNRVEVTSTSIAGTVFFCASATPAPAKQINIGSGNSQRAEAGGPAPEPLRVWVSDACNGAEGTEVIFTVMQGGGLVDGATTATATTGDTGHTEVDFELGAQPGINVVEATFLGNTGVPARFVVFGLERTAGQTTDFVGIVQNNAAQPIPGAACTLTVGNNTPLTGVTTDAKGRFSFVDIGAAGSAHLVVVGPTGYPSLAYEILIVPEAENSLPSPILLPLLDPDNNVSFDNTQDVELTVDGVEGLKMIVKGGSMTLKNGTVPSDTDPAVLSLNQVHADDVPMPMPDGAAPPFAWTLQPAGATFDPPIEIIYPNMSGLPAGSVAYFLSFNHDTNRFEIVSSGHVTDDGSCIVSDPGGGISVAGWGCNCPPYSVTGDCCDDECCGDPDPCCGTSDPCCSLDCDDGDPCTTDTCASGSCRHTLRDCNDGDGCTDDSCDRATGLCLNLPNTCNPCCTEEQDCVGSTCVRKCSECEIRVGGVCVAKDCTLVDLCFDSQCEAGTGDCLNTPKNCDDLNERTVDTCDPAIGCVHTLIECMEGDEDCEPGPKEDPPAKPTKPGEDPCKKSEAQDDKADPVYYFSGEFHETVEDLRIPGRGFDFVWTRTYRSKIGLTSGQGVGWDFSYNLFIEHDGPDVFLCDGKNRIDRYRMSPAGAGSQGAASQGGGVAPPSWSRNEYFRQFQRELNGPYTLTFEDKGEWEFFPFNGLPAAGKLKAIRDRNGNTMTFDYDASGRLTTIHDTLDTASHNRDIIVTYNTDGFIQSITDFAGRAVTYDYYDGMESGGNFGDLKSVTTPAVVPNGDFPFPDVAEHKHKSGKTTNYTYTAGFSKEVLNHNLLTITDPKGQLYLQNIYAHTIDPSDPRHTESPENLNFDRIVQQVWGNTGDNIDFFYAELTPSVDNNQATKMTVLNDRNGNVAEFCYDRRNRAVMMREYTGRADADTFTNEFVNRPANKLRSSDPDFFETRYEYNNDSLRTRIIHPNGNTTDYVYESDLNPGAAARIRGNLREIHHMPGSHVPVGDQTVITELFEYEMGFGCGGCGSNFVTKHTDGRGKETVHTYDPSGNREHTIHRIPTIVEDWEYNPFGQMTKHVHPDNGSMCRRVDTYTYYTTGDPTGYLEKEIVDDARDPDSCGAQSHHDLTTIFEYDKVGNVTRITDPRGNDKQFQYNQLNQALRTLSRELTIPVLVRYKRDTFYDANDNVVRVDIQNVGDDGMEVVGNTHFTTIYEYEILNYPIRSCEEAGTFTGAIPGTPHLPLCTGLPEAEFITTEYTYDANRNRTLTRYGEAVEGRQVNNVVRMEYDERDLLYRRIRADGDPEVSTSQMDYDRNRNIARIQQGIEDTPRITVNVYDGYNRVVATTDPMGNVTDYHYDANGNVGGDQIPGQPHLFGMKVSGQLADVEGSASNIRLQEAMYLYDDMDRLTSQTYEFFDTESQVSIGDGKATTTFVYTDNSQIKTVTDDNQHVTTTAYDAANRVEIVTDHKTNTVTYGYDANSNIESVVEVDKSDLGGQETITTLNEYDELDRLTKTTDNVLNINEFKYDSRSNRTQHIDAKRPAKASKGNITIYTYDGINRLTSTKKELTETGIGEGTPAGEIVTTQQWDDTSRLTKQIDDSSNTTEYVYDALNRMTTEKFADTTQHAYVFDVHDNRKQMTDANGSVSNSTHDLLNRLTAKTITPAASIVGTTFESYQYDGLSRIVSAVDDDSTVTRSYDSLSHTTKEVLNLQTTVSTYDGVGNQTMCTYPGGREIKTEYDELDRKKFVKEGVPPSELTIASYSYIGRTRVEQLDYPNSTRMTKTYDGVRRVEGTTHVFAPKGANTIIDSRAYLWDSMYNKTQRQDTRSPGPQLTHDYSYDSVYRLAHATAKDAAMAIVRDTDYDLDGVGNRTQIVGAPDPGPEVGMYTLDPTTPVPADDQMNQYTATPMDTRSYDENGNLTQLVEFRGMQKKFADVKYDYRNQMVQYVDLVLGQFHDFAYDCFGRRISRTVGGGTPPTTLYFYDGWRVCEEQDGGNVTLATYVYGNAIDEVLTMQRGGADYYYHCDDLYNVMAVTDSFGAAAERYEYGDYGQPSFFDGMGNPTKTTIDNPYLFNGRRFDGETGWYYYRTRYLDPLAGRFTTRDTIGIWGDLLNLGNGYTYVGNNPWILVDPFGTETINLGDEKWQKFTGESMDPIPSAHQRRGDHYINKATGERYWPDSGEIIDKNGKRTNASNKFKKKFKKELEARAKKAARKKAMKKAANAGTRTGLKIVKKCGGAVARKVPIIGVGFFVYDWIDGGLGHAANELTWPVSELWN